MSDSSAAEGVQADLASAIDSLVAWFDPQAVYVVALSGGVDSAVVAKAASLSAADARMVTARSPAVSAVELEDVQQLCQQVGLVHTFLDTDELGSSGYVENSASRCYFCKSELFAQIRECFPEATILTGTNHDDLSDFRPGLKAAAESGVQSPLAELGLSKAQVRCVATEWGLHVAEKPASPCLSSRIAHGVEVTRQRLGMIESAEGILRRLGLVDQRVRLHAGELARIEVRREDFETLNANRDAVAEQIKALGFRFVTLDMEPLRSGSQNAVYGIELKASNPRAN